ncbi:uncharacterized protein T551_02986 [Pneumocystis jirovecii RU7]|uniref:Uncharacterized protein n=1 Tax=Pneumocystis jirovecii (strain RU7) TaxID=1408657 RepID=A0A0W4ZGI3_PNEJ7|nr:uncharacterized protein T551_02986 [Pneumocystis jirovecii RU7]KTW27487.1 hypothetical protein T551_02986 [Pneumocystis jirovecii RU7]
MHILGRIYKERMAEMEGYVVRLLHAYITSGCVMKESGIWNERSRGSWPKSALEKKSVFAVFTVFKSVVGVSKVRKAKKTIIYIKTGLIWLDEEN